MKVLSRLPHFRVQLVCNPSGNNGHNGRCGQFFTYFVDIMDAVLLCGHTDN